MVKLIVSWESLQRRREELEELVTKKIPQNSKDIAVARSYGDLRENAEFKAAKEMQSVLMRRKGELELMLSHAQGTDFREVDASRVGAGTVVELEPVGTDGAPLRYTILGAWDSQPEEGIISYQTVVAQALIGHEVGEELDLALDGGQIARMRVTSITPYAAPTGT
ncbi:MAG: hypothetical protein HC901_02775 [Bdellovibrionaceae bacterium]|nr:hypothetical protein [Pseudobdellovibrionaceae bacterium]